MSRHRRLTELHALHPAPDDYEKFAATCEAGAQRHGGLWLSANQAAVSVATGAGFDVSKPALKRFLTLLILRVLDQAERAYTQGADDEKV